MNTEKILELISSSEKEDTSSIPLYDIGILKRNTDISLEMDREKNEYFYAITLESIPDDNKEVNEILSKYNWKIDTQKKEIVFNINF
jgi:hypothetical protein